MAKLTGIILVAAAAVYYAFYGLFALKQKLYLVRELMNAAVCLRSAVGCTQKCVEDVFKELEKNEKNGVFKRFRQGMRDKKGCEELWRACLEQTPLEKEERDIFMPLGASLAAADRTYAIKILDMTAESAKRYEAALLEKIEKYKSAEMKVRIMCGLMAVILLI